MANDSHPDDSGPEDSGPDGGRLLAIADELYGLPLAEFTPRRDALAKELKTQDPALSAAVKGLRKASVAAWVVDLLVRRETGQVGQLLDVGAALRQAQADLDGAELRELTRQRRQLTSAVTVTARRHAKAEGVKVTDAVADQVEQTLTAAMLDENAAAAVRSGLLVAALTPTTADRVGAAVALPEALGFSASPADGAPAAGSGGPGSTATARPGLRVAPDPDAEAKALAAAEELLAIAEQARAEAAEALETASGEVSDLEARSLQLQGELDELRLKVEELETAAETVEDELSEAEDARAEAEGALTEATRERDGAAEALDRLRG